MTELYFKPDIITVAVGEEFDVEVWVDTGGKVIDGSDVFIPLKSFTLVKFMGNNLTFANRLELQYQDVFNNVLRFSHMTQPFGSTFMGLGKIATLTVKAGAIEDLEFHWTLGSTIDTNLSHAGQDLLTSVGKLLLIEKGEFMIDPALLAGLKDLADLYKVGIKGTVTPMAVPPPESFDVAPSS
jgi:hypothetical protein